MCEKPVSLARQGSVFEPLSLSAFRDVAPSVLTARRPRAAMESGDDWVLLPDERAPPKAPREADSADSAPDEVLPAAAGTPALPPLPAPPVAEAADDDAVAPLHAQPGVQPAQAHPVAADSLGVAALLVLLYCLVCALLQGLGAWAPAAVQRASFGAAVAPRAHHAHGAAPPLPYPYNLTQRVPVYTFRGPNASTLQPLRVTLPCAMCVADADAAACSDCAIAPFARYGRALRDRRDVARLMRSHASAGL